MKKILFHFLLIFLLTSISSAPNHFELQVIVKEFEEVKGSVRICLANSKEGFMKKCFEFKEVEVKNREEKIKFSNLPEGEYAISLFHDEDRNGKINTKGLLGLPSENYGFSNNPRLFLSLPKYRDCAFKVNSNKTITINLK